MSRLHIVVGYPDQTPGSSPFPVYVGQSGDEARAAMAVSTAARFVILANPLGIRKVNPRAAANAAAKAIPIPYIDIPAPPKPVPLPRPHRPGPPGDR